MTNKQTFTNGQGGSMPSSNLENHYGYGVRKDEEPFADKIPPGGNWKDLPIEDQLIYWNGKIPEHGGNTNGLRRRSWKEAAGTITAAPIQKLSCQLHPGKKDWESEDRIQNHSNYPKRKFGGRREERFPTSWDSPAPTLCVGGEATEGNRSGGASSPIHPSYFEESCPENHEIGLPSLYSEVPGYDSCDRGKTWSEPSLTIRGNSITGLPWHPDRYDQINERKRDYKRPLLDAMPQINARGIKAVSLFSGGGLLDLGAIHAGIEVIWASEFDLNATTAYRHNIGEHIVGPRTKKEAREKVVGNIELIPIETIPDADIVIGGPPCQDYSTAGTGSGEDGARGKLVWRYLEIVSKKQFKAFLFENVKGLTTQKHKHTFYSLIAKFEEIGYSVSWKVLNSWDYGVAQTRERVFLIGRRRDNEPSPALLTAISDLKMIADTLRQTADPKGKRNLIRVGDALLDSLRKFHESDGSAFAWPKSEYESGKYRPVLRDAIGDLPDPSLPLEIDEVESVTKKRADNEQDKTSIIDAPQGEKAVPNELFNHNEKLLSKGEYAHAKKYKIGYNTSLDRPAATIRTKGDDVLDSPYALTDRAGFAFVENHRKKDFYMPKSEYTFEQANRVQSMDLPCSTIPAHHNNGQPIHPTQKPRRFTVRECLRIQSVPDSYVFPEHLSLSSMYRIVGNGVPSRVAYHLFKALGEQMISSQY